MRAEVLFACLAQPLHLASERVPLGSEHPDALGRGPVRKQTALAGRADVGHARILQCCEHVRVELV